MAVELKQIFRQTLKLDPVDRLLTLQGFEER
jgi:hypothetical protein